MDIPFKPGDLVRLKSGGPVMAVDSVGTGPTGLPHVFCIWHDDEDRKDKRREYTPAVLELALPDPEPSADNVTPIR